MVTQFYGPQWLIEKYRLNMEKFLFIISSVYKKFGIDVGFDGIYLNEYAKWDSRLLIIGDAVAAENERFIEGILEKVLDEYPVERITAHISNQRGQ